MLTVSEVRRSDPTDRPTGSRSPGWGEVLAVAAVLVGVVLGLAVVTSVLPAGFQDVIFRSPLAIVVLVVGTIGLLVWLAQRPHPEA
jgi:threonine/homoserine/homoserine lactone efflux protein